MLCENIKTSFLGARKLPLVIEPQDDAKRNSSLETLVSVVFYEGEFFRTRLLERGALLFRGFSVNSPSEFE